MARTDLVLGSRVGSLTICLALLAFAAVILGGGVGQAAPAVFTVNSTNDADDGTCEATHCSLREALNAANANPGTDTVAFNIPGAGPDTIEPASALPTVTDPVTIDGTSEPDFSGTPIIELDGSGAGFGADGLTITAGSSMVKGLVINRFGGDGIELSTSGGNTIEGNYIGTDVTGTADLGNSWNGVRIGSASNNTIGGTAVGAGNVVSGNDGSGVYISGSGATGNLLQGNYIGTDVTGSLDLGNSSDGVYISSGNNTIGGTAVGAGNAISANGGNGVWILPGGTGNVVKGNYIGTDVTGTVDLGNSGDGVWVWSDDNTIGGAAPGERNVVSGNGEDGVSIGGMGKVVKGNYIGTDVSGGLDIGNSWSGVGVGGADNIIGGSGPGEGNVVSGNGRRGVTIGGTRNVVQGNYIGTDFSGTVALGNFRNGVYIGGTDNTVGGSDPEEGNVISGNGQSGVRVGGYWSVGGSHDTTGHRVQGNYIGTDVSGSLDLGNGHAGVFIWGAVPGDVYGIAVGGTAPGEGNTIAFNTGNGVCVLKYQHDGQTGVPTGISIRGNSIHSNDFLGIHLEPPGQNWNCWDGTVTANDAGDGDTGPNNLQNFPVLTSATSGSTNIKGSLNSTADTQFTIEFFSNAACDPSGHGEGATFLGSSTETTDGTGDVSFAVSFPTSVPVGHFITSTATDPDGNTSEFSECIEVEGDGPTPDPDLAVTKSCTPDPVRTVHNIECTLSVSNAGSGEALDVQVVDTLPLEAKSFIDVSPGAPTCTEAGGVVTCDLGTLAADDGTAGGPDEATIIITFQAPKTGWEGPQDNVTITNCAEVSASNEPPENVGPENQACDDTTVLWKCPDVNGDGVASLGDLALIALHWRKPVDDKFQQFLDLNNDGIVSLGDLALVALRWREECPL